MIKNPVIHVSTFT